MKLLLTSAGFENPIIGSEFLKLVGKPARKIKVVFIPTASTSEEELFYVGKSKDELACFGIKLKNIVELNIDHKIYYSELKDFDVMYMCGGNTFHLLSQIKKFDFDKVIEMFIKSNRVYVGVSAGSLIMGPNIELAKFGDKKVGRLKDFTGLEYIDEAIAPHVTDEDVLQVKAFQKKVNYKIIPLNDSQAVRVIDEKSQIVG
jgi:dipeptidase E